MEITIPKTAGLAPYSVRIQELVRQTLNEVEGKLSLGDVEVVVKESQRPADIKDIGGVGGYCPNEKLVEISVDVNNPDFQKNWEQLIRRTLIHELHHAARRQAGVAIGESSFLECLFSEGLADHFVYDLTNTKPVWVIDLDAEVMNSLLQRADKIFNDTLTDELYEGWFSKGSTESNVPRWAGYAVGYKLVADYLDGHSGSSAASLVAVPVDGLMD
jgi:uncharacterized protein YjaZ